jgi:hypothetical protein
MADTVHQEGFRVVGVPSYSLEQQSMTVVMPSDSTGHPTPEGVPTYDEAQALGDHMLETGNWSEYRVEKHYYREVP